MPNAKRDEGLTLAAFVPYQLSVLDEKMSRQLARRYEARFGVSAHEWRVLASLGERAPRSTQDVIEVTEMDRVRVSRAVIRLADKGLIERKAKGGDRRAQVLGLSEGGRDIYSKIAPIARAFEASLMSALTPDQCRAFGEIFRRLNARLAELETTEVR